MNRLFGTKKAPPPKPTMTDAISSIDSHVDSIEIKIKKLDAELNKYKDQLGKMREGPSKNAVKQRALNILKQKKQYETQKMQLMQQSFNIEQANYTVETLQNTAASVSVLKQANKEMKRQFKGLNIDKIENAQDEMAELLQDAEEIQLAMSRTYGVPDDLDVEDLEAELEALTDDLNLDDIEVEPCYLEDLPISSNTNPIAASGPRAAPSNTISPLEKEAEFERH